jgi:hypothetical protein
MIAAVAALAMCMMGSAFARDAQPDRRSDCAGRREQPRRQPVDGPGARHSQPDARPAVEIVREGLLQPYADWHRARLPV